VTGHGRAGRRLLAACLGATALAGCLEKGDFGRVRHSTWNDIVLGTGSLAAGVRSEPVSPFPLTDAEAELRGRAWRFLVPAHSGAYLDRLLAELVATRLLSPDMRSPDIAAYFGALSDNGAISPSSRYRRLAEDAAADSRLLDPLARTAGRVLAADKVRLAALDRAGLVSAGDVAGAKARVLENRCLLAWVRLALADRIASYRFALEHLVIESPETAAVPAERALSGLAGAATLLDGLALPPLAACLGDGPLAPAAAPAPPPPLVAKG